MPAVPSLQQQNRSRCISLSETFQLSPEDGSQTGVLKSSQKSGAVSSLSKVVSSAALNQTEKATPFISSIKPSAAVSSSKRTRSHSFSACFDSNIPRGTGHAPSVLASDFRVPEIVMEVEPTPLEPIIPSVSSSTARDPPVPRNTSLADCLASNSCSKKKMALLRSPIFLAYLARLSIGPQLRAEEAATIGSYLKLLQEDLETRESLEEIRRLLLKGDQDLAHSRPGSRGTSGISTPDRLPCNDRPQHNLGNNRNRGSQTSSATSNSQRDAGVSVDTPSKSEYHSIPVKSGGKKNLLTSSQMCDFSIVPQSVKEKPHLQADVVTGVSSQSRKQLIHVDRDLNAVAPSSY